jgi:transposase-like protein
MGERRKFSAEYKREAVAMLDTPGVTVRQIAADLGVGANVLGRWRGELRRHPEQALGGHGHRTAEHWLYLCVVLDLYSGLMVGWSMSPRQDRQLVVQRC